MSLLLIISFPLGYLSFYSTFSRRPLDISKMIKINTLRCIIYYLISIIIASVLGTIFFYEIMYVSLINTSLFNIVSTGILFSIIALVLEIIVGKFLTRRKIQTDIIAYEIVSTNVFLENLLIIFVIPIIEEYLFRGIIFSATLWATNSIIFSIIFSSVTFGLAHGSLGFKVVIQKSITGVLLSMTLIITNYSLLAPIICHLFENILILYFFQ